VASPFGRYRVTTAELPLQSASLPAAPEKPPNWPVVTTDDGCLPTIEEMKAATNTVCTSAESVKFWASVSRPGHQLHQLLGSCWVLLVGWLATVVLFLPAAVATAALSQAARFALCLQGDTEDNDALANSERQCFADWLSSGQVSCPASCIITFTEQVRSNLAMLMQLPGHSPLPSPLLCQPAGCIAMPCPQPPSAPPLPQAGWHGVRQGHCADLCLRPGALSNCARVGSPWPHPHVWLVSGVRRLLAKHGLPQAGTPARSGSAARA
jgi:hypothetical protein